MVASESPSASPDGKQIVFTMWDAAGRNSLVEIAADGTELHTIQKDACCSRGLLTGNIWCTKPITGSDIWALPMQTGPFQRSQKPIRLTTGPLSYMFATPSANGKQIFAIGLKERGELVRYDMKSQAVRAVPLWHLGHVCNLLPGWRMGHLHFPTRPHSLAEPQRWQRTETVDLPSDGGLVPLYFA